MTLKHLFPQVYPSAGSLSFPPKMYLKLKEEAQEFFLNGYARRF